MEDSNKKRRSSILKPQKPRNPLGDLDLCESNTESSKSTVRRISFANSNLVKPFVEDEDKNTIWDNTYEEVAQHPDSSHEGTTMNHDKSILGKSKNTLDKSKNDEPDMLLSNSDMDISLIDIRTDADIASCTSRTSPSSKENTSHMIQKGLPSDALTHKDKMKSPVIKILKNIQTETYLNKNKENYPVVNNSINIEEMSMEFTQQLSAPLANVLTKNSDDTVGSCDMEFTKVVTSPNENILSTEDEAENVDLIAQNVNSHSKLEINECLNSAEMEFTCAIPNANQIMKLSESIVSDMELTGCCVSSSSSSSPLNELNNSHDPKANPQNKNSLINTFVTLNNTNKHANENPKKFNCEPEERFDINYSTKENLSTKTVLQNKEITNNSMEDRWCNLTRFSNNDILNNVSLEDMPCLSFDDENYGTSGPFESDISKVMCGDYNPSFNSKIMNALPMSFNSDLIPRFLSKSVENSLCEINQEHPVLKESSVYIQPSITLTQPSIVEVTDISIKPAENVNYTKIDYSNVTFFKEFEDTNMVEFQIDREFDEKSDKIINTIVKKIALLMKRHASNRKKILKDIEIHSNSVNEIDTLLQTVNSSVDVSVSNTETVTDQPENLNEKSLSLSLSKICSSINVDANVPFCNKSIKEKIEMLALRNEGCWNIISLGEKYYTFSTLYETIILKVTLDAESGIVDKVEVTNNINEKSEPFSKFVCALFVEKLKIATIQSALGSDKFEIISFLEYVSVTVEKMLNVCRTYDNLRRDDRYLLKMEDSNRASFHIIRIKPLIHWIINVDMSDVNNITADSIDIIVRIGCVEKNIIKKFVYECPKGFEFLPNFVQKIEDHINALIEKLTKSKHKNVCT